MTHAQSKKCQARSTRTFELLSIEIYSVVPRVQNAFQDRSPFGVVEADVLSMTETQFLNQCGTDAHSGTSFDRELSPERYGVGSIKTRADLCKTKIVIVTADCHNFARNRIHRF